MFVAAPEHVPCVPVSSQLFPADSQALRAVSDVDPSSNPAPPVGAGLGAPLAGEFLRVRPSEPAMFGLICSLQLTWVVIPGFAAVVTCVQMNSLPRHSACQVAVAAVQPFVTCSSVTVTSWVVVEPVTPVRPEKVAVML